MKEVINDLRALYRSSRRTACTDDGNGILDFLVEDLIENTGFERIVVLRLDSVTHFLETQVYYGFHDVSECGYRVFFDEVNGLLRKVYNDREPLNVIHCKGVTGNEGASTQPCDIVKDTHRTTNGTNGTNGRIRMNPCVPELTFSPSHSGQIGQYQHYSIMHMDGYDQTISGLLGDVTSFLILPICDKTNFFGFVLADKSFSEKDITCDELSLAFSLVSHAECSLGRVLAQKEMIDKIADQLIEIQELKSFYQSIIQNMRSGLITANQFMEINEVNTAAENLLGYQGRELLGKPLTYLFAEKNNNNRCLYFDTVDEMDSCMGSLAELSMRKKNREIIAAEVCFSAIKDIHNDISGVSCIFRDIGARKIMEQNLARVDKLASLGELAAGMAHEIKNPLAGIAGAMQIMAKNYHVEHPHHFVFNAVQEQVKRLDSFVNNLLQFARPGQAHFSDIDMVELLDKILFLVMGQLDKKKIGVRKVYEKPLPRVQGDAGQLQQVFLNIAINAIDAMDIEGSLTLQIQAASPSTSPIGHPSCTRLSCLQSPAMLNISIADTGYGIAPDSLEKIFNPFHTTKCKGTGLGLSISQRMVELHGGVITAKSSIGVGSTFTVSLPIYAPLASHESSDTLFLNGPL